MLTMFDPRQDLALGGPVALEFVGDDHPWHVPHTLEKLAEELLCSLLISPALHQDIQHVPLLIDCPPQIMMLAFDRQKHLIEVPFIAGPGAAATELIGILLAELATPLADGLIGYHYAPLEQELFDIAVAQAEAKVQPYCVTNDLHRKAVVLVATVWRWCVHTPTLTQSVEAQQVDNASPRTLRRVALVMRLSGVRSRDGGQRSRALRVSS